MSTFDKGFLTFMLLFIFGMLLILAVSVDNSKGEIEKLEQRIELLEGGTTAYLLE